MRGKVMTKTVILFVSVIFLGAQCNNHTPSEYDRIFNLPREQEREEFNKLPLDKQVDMYLVAMAGEPPNTIYISFLVSNGKAVMPHMLKRLEEEKEDYAKSDLVLAFRDMHRNIYNLHDESEVIFKLRQATQTIKHPFWKEKSKEYIEEIINGQGVSNSN